MNAKSRKTSAEAQFSQAPSEEDFVGLIKTIMEKEKGLSLDSDKLRQAMELVAKKFGNEKGQIFISIDVCDDEPFLSTEDKDEEDDKWVTEDYFLAIENHILKIIRKDQCQRICADHPVASGHPRETLSALVKSGRLPKFLQLVAQKLADAQKEYAQVAEIAEKMANAIK